MKLNLKTHLMTKLFAFAILFSVFSCAENSVTPIEKGLKTKEDAFEVQKSIIDMERESIELYIKDRGLEFKRSGTGLFSKLEASSNDSLQIESGDIVVYSYNVELLNGHSIYSSDENGPKALQVDKQDEILGIHEALKQMSLGQIGLFILPSHLAYGVAGDQNRVPPYTALVYQIEILEINKVKKDK